MQTLTNKLNEPYRSAVRFTIVGTTGTLIQYAWYWLFLYLFSCVWPEKETTTLAFIIGFILEMVSNYCLTAYYTFKSRPNWKNFGGFLSGRAVNFILQMLMLQLLLMVHLSDQLAGLLAIIVAGIINYFVVKLFFKDGASQNKSDKGKP